MHAGENPICTGLIHTSEKFVITTLCDITHTGKTLQLIMGIRMLGEGTLLLIMSMSMLGRKTFTDEYTTTFL